MTQHEFEILSSNAAREIIEKNIDQNPINAALKLGGGDGATISTQIKYLQRCKTKLPRYFAARCIIPPISYEQCSSEAAAATKRYSGGLCIDLTCGLGVDTLNFSQHFNKVITIERDNILAQVAKHNLSLLGAENAEVINTNAEDFVTNYKGSKADLIYIDPSRRSEDDKRVFLLEDCSPNVIKLMDQLVTMSERVVIKLSPLFDIDEVLRIFGDLVTRIEIVSIGNECKEVVVELASKSTDCELVINSSKGIYKFAKVDMSQQRENWRGDIEDYRFISIPDSALVKARLTTAYIEKFMSNEATHSGFIFSQSQPENFCGRVFRIIRAEKYDPKALKKEFKNRNIKRLNIIRRNFKPTTKQITTELGVSEGGEETIAFTEIDGANYLFFLLHL